MPVENEGILERQVTSSTKNEIPVFYNVIFWNDDVTPMDCVVDCLVTAFDKDPLTALSLTFQIDSTDKGIVGTYSLDEAYERVDRAEAICAEYSAPLLITVEEVE